MFAHAIIGSLMTMQIMFLFQEGRYPLVRFNCRMETMRMKMHNFVSNKLVSFLLLSNITK
jgi:hypothetical protein